jgi:hypothetical protein
MAVLPPVFAGFDPHPAGHRRKRKGGERPPLEKRRSAIPERIPNRDGLERDLFPKTGIHFFGIIALVPTIGNP